MELRALSEFQSIPSIGIRFAHDLISLGLYSLADVKGKDPAKLLDRFEQQLGVWIDPVWKINSDWLCTMQIILTALQIGGILQMNEKPSGNSTATRPAGPKSLARVRSVQENQLNGRESTLR